MAGVNLELLYKESDWEKFKEIAQHFSRTFFPSRVMAYVGARGKERLKKHFLSGQELNLKGGAYAKDVMGRRLISYKVLRWGEAVKISSYPVNLFERGRMLRSGRKEKGKRIIKGKFKALMNSDLQKILNDFDSKILEQEYKRLG